MYAKGLIYLCCKQKPGEILGIIKRLSRLVLRYPDEKDIAEAYAKGLVILSRNQNIKGLLKTAKKLERLVVQFPEEFEIISCYSELMICLGKKQGIKKTVKQVREFIAQISGKQEIINAFYNTLIKNTNSSLLSKSIIRASIKKQKKFKKD